VPYIDIGSVDRGRKAIRAPEAVSGTSAPTRARQWVHTDDVLVSMTRPNLNAVAMVPATLDGAVASTGFDVLRARGVLPRWLYLSVRSSEFVADICSGLQGVVYPAVRPREIRGHSLPIPPLAEQRRIVDAVDSYLSRLDEAEGALERVQCNLKRYRSAVLQAAVEGRLVPTEAELARSEGRDYERAPELLRRILAERRRRWEEAELARLTSAGKQPKDDKWRPTYQEPDSPVEAGLPVLPSGWCWAEAGQLAVVGTGATPKRGEDRYWTDGTLPWVTSAVVNSRLVREPSEFVTEAALRETNLTLYPPGTLLLAMYGEGQTRGRVAELGITATTNQALAALVLNGPAKSVGAWLRLCLEQKYEALRRSASGGVQPNLNLGIVRRFHVPLPPVAEQGRIVECVQSAFSVVDSVESVARLNAERSSRNRQSILKWAFEGRLVDQDPNDEPASVLLERIRQERAQPGEAAAKPRKARARKAR
jgi:type I restriction enzyme S subunit